MALYRDIAEGAPPPGIEYYLPLFFDATATLFDYLPGNTIVAAETEVQGAAAQVFGEIASRYEQRGHDAERPILEPAAVFTPVDELVQRLGTLRRIELSRVELDPLTQSLPYQNFATRSPPALAHRCAQRRAGARARALPQRLSRPRADCGRVGRTPRDAAGHPAEADLRPQLVDSWSAFVEGSAPLGITVSPIATGLVLTEPPLALIAEEQLFGERARQERRPTPRRARSRKDHPRPYRSAARLAGRARRLRRRSFVSLATLDVGGLTNEFLLLEYADGDKLYVPVHALDLVSRYTGAPTETAPLHKLGTDTWEKAEAQSRAAHHDTAAELLDLYSRRAARQGEQLDANEAELRTFEAAFPFEETPDQSQAIEQVIADLAAGKPMDRVVCGDVGFGKTEVALRAAFVTVQAGKQVRGAGADDAAGAAALPDLRRSLRRLAREGRSAVALSQRARSRASVAESSNPARPTS
jgi:transcription-repair coupling factor (superfamily II helicase)